MVQWYLDVPIECVEAIWQPGCGAILDQMGIGSASATGTADPPGLVVMGVPVGSDAYEQAGCVNIAQQIIDRILNPLVETRLHGSALAAPALQTLFSILRMCINARFNHVLRCVSPINTLAACRRLDSAVQNAVLSILNIRMQLTTADMTRIRMLLSLPIRHGGMGLLSNEAIAPAAYIGSWALSGALVANILPGVQNPATQANHPGLHALNQTLQSHPALTERLASLIGPGPILTAIFTRQFARVQHVLSDIIHVTNKVALTASLTPRQLTIFNSQSSQYAGAWLAALPKSGHEQTLSDRVFEIGYLTRLMIPFTPGPMVPPTCPACHSHIDASSLLDHAFNCESVGGYRTRRHTKLIHVLRKCISSAGVDNHKEIPLTVYHFARRPGFTNNINLQADILTYNAGAATCAIDISVKNPDDTPNRQPLPPGTTARDGELKKLRKYNRQLVFPQGGLVPFSLETHGAWGEMARSYFRSLAARIAQPNSKEYMAWVFHWSKAISCTLIRGNADVLAQTHLNLSRVAPVHPLIPAHYQFLPGAAPMVGQSGAAMADPT